jgi:hypothetical protein
MAGQVFTLEALQAAHGDALLLHYGTLDHPRLIVIDGGPAGVYKASLDPRLKQIHAARGGAVLEIRMVMVSHIDDDHIVGVLELTKALRELQDRRATLPYDILTLWHNSFDDIADHAGGGAGAALRAAALGTRAPADAAAIVASVPQGRQLRLDADKLGINMNSGFDDLIRFDGDEGLKALRISPGLTFKALGPRQDELDALEAKWDKEVKAFLTKKKKKKKKRKKKPAPGGGSEASLSPAELDALAAEFVDDSVHNLSSLVVLAEFAGKRMLLTGDARGDFIVESLRQAGLLKNGKFAVDILKVPHHGSIHNVEKSFFQTIVADHYVFSANGRDGNPDPPTFDLLFDARPTGRYHLWLTNDVAKSVTRIKNKKPSGVKLHVRETDALSVRIELGSAITW